MTRQSGEVGVLGFLPPPTPQREGHASLPTGAWLSFVENKLDNGGMRPEEGRVGEDT